MTVTAIRQEHFPSIPVRGPGSGHTPEYVSSPRGSWTWDFTPRCQRFPANRASLVCVGFSPFAGGCYRS